MRLARLALAVPVVGLILACGGAFSDTDDFYATVDGPPSVAEGEPFTVTITVHNDAEAPQELDSLDLGEQWLEGVAVTATSPPAVDTMAVPIDGTVSYAYGLDIPAGGSATVTLEAIGTRAGAWRGEVDVCVGGMARFRTYPLVTVVQ